MLRFLTPMFTPTVAALAVLLSVTCSAAPIDDGKPYKIETFSGIGAVRAQTSGGSLTVEGGSGQTARVEMYVRANGGSGQQLSNQEIEERLADYDVMIRQEGTTLVATARPKREGGNWWNSRKNLSISFKFFTPRTLNTKLNTSGGSISLSHLTGSQQFETSGGSLHMTDLAGQLSGRTSGGSISLDGCRDQIDLTTSGGSITATNSSGTIKLETSGGSLRLARLNGLISARTSGGSISADQIDGELKTSTSGGSVRISDMAGSIDASTSGGSMTVSMTRVDKFVTLSTSAGSVRVQMPLNKGIDLDMDGSRVSAPLTNFSGRAEKDRIVGKLNGGGVPVRLTASSGSVYLNQN